MKSWRIAIGWRILSFRNSSRNPFESLHLVQFANVPKSSFLVEDSCVSISILNVFGANLLPVSLRKSIGVRSLVLHTVAGDMFVSLITGWLGEINSNVRN